LRDGDGGFDRRGTRGNAGWELHLGFQRAAESPLSRDGEPPESTTRFFLTPSIYRRSQRLDLLSALRNAITIARKILLLCTALLPPPFIGRSYFPWTVIVRVWDIREPPKSGSLPGGFPAHRKSPAANENASADTVSSLYSQASTFDIECPCDSRVEGALSIRDRKSLPTFE
jgi:hypothetical protein